MCGIVNTLDSMVAWMVNQPVVKSVFRELLGCSKIKESEDGCRCCSTRRPEWILFQLQNAFALHLLLSQTWKPELTNGGWMGSEREIHAKTNSYKITEYLFNPCWRDESQYLGKCFCRCVMLVSFQIPFLPNFSLHLTFKHLSLLNNDISAEIYPLSQLLPANNTIKGCK